MIKATIQRTPYCTEMTFPCTETQLSTWLDELRMNPEHLCPAATITQIEPAELSILEDCEVSLDALNYLAKRMDGMSHAEQNQFFAALTCEELDIGWGMKNIINLTFNLDRFTLIEDTSDLEKVGLTHQLNIRGAIPASELEDKEWLVEDGKKLLDSGKGIHLQLTVCLNCTRFLGYDKDENGRLVVVESEAVIVRKIFELYLNGFGVRKIKKYLEENGIKTVTGKDVWSTSTIDRILSNEKYVGDVLMQKSFTEDFLTGKRKKNEGELDMYFIENDHKAIVSREMFENVQKRKNR